VNAERFPELPGREQQAERAAELLSRAAAAVTALAPGEDWREQAERLRGAATFAQTAAAELLATCGYLEAADAAERAGLLEPG
jgi:L-asparaginase II